MDDAVQSGARHNVNEQRGDLVETMENERVAPHDDGDGIISKSQAVCCREESLRAGKGPQAQGQEQVDEVTKVRQEVVIASSAIKQEADRHEVKKLNSVPDVKVLWPCPNEIATDEDVHDAKYKGYLLAEADGLGVCPLLAKLIDPGAHLLLVTNELLIGRGYATPPFLDHAILRILSSRLESFARAANLASLAREALLQLLKLLGEREIIEEIKDANAVKRRKGIPIVVI